MEGIEGSAGLEVLLQTNQRIGAFFARFSGTPVQGSQEEVEALLQLAAALRSVGALLDGQLQNSRASGVREELARYRANLLRLQAELGTMQSAATLSRDSLLMRQKHLNAAKAWCMASRATT